MFSDFTFEARRTLEHVTAIGFSKKTFAPLGAPVITGLATELIYIARLGHFFEWRKMNYDVEPRAMILEEEVWQYLELSGELVSQSELDQRRRALEMATGMKIPAFQSEIAAVSHSRALTATEYIKIMSCMTDLYQFILLLLLSTGVRASQIASVPPLGRFSPSAHRFWSPKLHLGRNNFEVRNVKGKGGLIAPVAFDRALIPHLESLRLQNAEPFFNRGIPHERYYDLPTGQSISQAFTSASQKALGFSAGVQSTRHFFVQTRMRRLIELGIPVREALKIVSQSVGHFRESITYAYF